MISKEKLFQKGLKSLILGGYFFGLITGTNAVMHSCKRYERFGAEYRTEIKVPLGFYKFEIRDDEISLTDFNPFRRSIEYIDKNRNGEIDVIVKKYGRRFLGESYRRVSFDRLTEEDLKKFEMADQVYNRQLQRFDLEDRIR